MAIIQWIASGLLILQLSNHHCTTGQYFDPYFQYDYYDNVNSFAPVINNCNTPVPIIPVVPVPAAANGPCNDTGTNPPISGNSLYLVVDPETQRLSIQISPPCNQTNATTGNGKVNSTLPKTKGDAGGTGVCTVISLITDIVNSLLNLVNSILTKLISAIVGLVTSLLNSLVIPLLDAVTTGIESLLSKTLLGVLDGVENVVNSTLNNVLGKDLLVSGLVGKVENLLGTQPALTNVTDGVTKLLNDTVLGLLDDVEKIVKDLLDPASVNAVLPELTQKVTSLVNATLQNLLVDVEKSVEHLLNGLLGNGSLTTNLTGNVETLLTDVLNDTICDVQRLLNDTNSLSAVLVNVEKLVDDLLSDVLKNVSTLLTNLLTDALGKSGLLDTLLKDILKLVSDLLTSLLGKKVNGMMPMKEPSFKEGLLTKLTEPLTKLLTGATPTSAPSIPDPSNITQTPAALIPEILKLVDETLTEILSAVDQLLTGLTKIDSPVMQNPISELLKGLEKLIQDLLKNLLGQLLPSLTGTLGNSTGLIDLPALTSPIGTIVTGILKGALGCNVTCNGTIPSPIPNPVNPGNSSNPAGPGNPCCGGSSAPANPKCSTSATKFLDQLQQYQSAICQNFFRNLNPSCSNNAFDTSGLLNSLVNSNFPLCAPRASYNNDDSGFGELSDGLLSGVDNTAQFTSNIGINGLLSLVNSVAQDANTTDSLSLPII